MTHAAVKAYRSAEVVIEVAKNAQARIKAARDKAAAKRSELYAAMVEAARSGTPQVETIRITGYSRERVRSILRDGGIEADR